MAATLTRLLLTESDESYFDLGLNQKLLKENRLLSSRVSFEDLVLVLLGVGLKRSVPTETLQTTHGQ